MSARKTVLSAIQPTGNMHLGNYFGAVKNWVDLQEKYTCYYGVVDYHAMTMPYDVQKLRTNTWDLITNLVAVGVNPENLFIQSLVPEHTELTWIFNCFCSYGQLTRMTQFKDKSTQVKDSGKEDYISAGLLDYPVLQAADILIYRADFVPVGKDQEQHLELTRDIAQRFNFQAGKEYFVLPDALYTETPKIRSTADPSKKMSKSAGEKHYINVFADEETIRRQIKSAVTDSGDTPAGKMAEGVENLFELIKATGNKTDYDRLLEDFHAGTLKYVDLKQVTADNLVAMTSGFIEKKKEISSDKRKLKDQVKQSSFEIRKRAQETVREVKELIGLMNV
ncbi:MAG: tryptophan--tRNA ligase [Saprospiraceae bacterium]|jgi:tryptophanyl-tRNA synthetase|nr:tryptophan--tRNA ligase [Saprospiraceae bacterium]MBK8885466.1 tryptophan--tRNA ligase [Saprospiraceae bacterium]MBK9581056.1 tryptophan--tRNA ligase [Saprospiraceae bacterium]MBK9742173.1 tryptophan--tRNA ligase [Saprospiraceae bacterium]MBP6539380.1 tryptophan--tRNA ligase [Saprospiraceae bacterium]